MTDLGHRLTRLAARQGLLTQTAAAQAAGVHPVYWHQVTQGKKDPRVSTLEAMVTALGCTMADLYSDDPAPKPRQRRLPKTEAH